MNGKQFLIIGGLLASVAGLSIVAVAAAPAGPNLTGIEAAGGPAFLGAMHKARSEGRRWGHGHSGFRGKFCGKRHGKRMERMTNVIEGLMTFTPPQQTAWNDLKTAMNDGKASMEKACESAKSEDKPKTAPERMARMEAMMTTRLGALQTVRPAFDTFYGTLSDKQKSAIDGLVTRGHGKFKRGDHGKSGDRGQRGPHGQGKQ
jgi:periplasmic protein CpxP/Spy